MLREPLRQVAPRGQRGRVTWLMLACAQLQRLPQACLLLRDAGWRQGIVLRHQRRRQCWLGLGLRGWQHSVTSHALAVQCAVPAYCCTGSCAVPGAAWRPWPQSTWPQGASSGLHGPFCALRTGASVPRECCWQRRRALWLVG